MDTDNQRVVTMGDFTRRVMPEFLIGFFKISEISEISGPYFPLLDEAKRRDGEGAEEDAEMSFWIFNGRGSNREWTRIGEGAETHCRGAL